jgi:hypothetical protein
MLSKIESFFDELVSALAPEMALAGGIPFPKENIDKKPTLALHKGGGKAPAPAPPPPPPAPIIILPPPPKPPPPPPPPPTASSADVAAQQQSALQNNAGRFGFKASLLKDGKAESSNSATGSGSLLGS